MDSRTSLDLALIGDQGVYRVQGHTWYYQFKYMDNLQSGSGSNNIADAPNGPAEEATAKMLWSWKPSEVIMLGDIVYNLGASSHIDDDIGQFYNQYMSSYPSPFYSNAFEVPQIDPNTGLPATGNATDSSKPVAPYIVSPGDGVFDVGRKDWVVTNTDVTASPISAGTHDFYILYDYPNGYPNPENSGISGGSPDGVNHLWYNIGNHEWNFPSYTNIVLPSNTSKYAKPGILGYAQNEPEVTYGAPNSVVDYFPWMQQPSLAGVSSLEIGNLDQYGDTGNYYTVTWGKTADNRPLVRLISLDVNRIIQDAKQGANSRFDPSVPAGDQLVYNLRDPASPTSRDSAYQQYLWFNNVLQKDDAEWTIVIGHQPAYGSGLPPTNSNDATYPANEGTNAPILKFLAADTEHKIDMFVNGHAHYYERDMESTATSNGLGLGVPSITGGGGGKNFDVLRYVNVLDPLFSTAFKDANPQLVKDLNDGVMPNTNPLRIAQLGIQKNSLDPTAPVIDGAYGYGASKVDVNSDYLYYRYQSTKVLDPAFVTALTNAGVKNADSWSPTRAAKIDIVVGMYQDGNPNTMVAPYNPDTQQALFKAYKPTGNEGVYSVKVIDAGEGYPTGSGIVTINMQLPGGSSEQNGAILKLTFSDGKLLGQPEIVDPGKGYWSAYYSIKQINKSASMLLTLDADLTNTLYPETVFPGATQKSDYYDYFLSTDTKIDSDIILKDKIPLGIAFSVQPSNHKAEVYLDEAPAAGLNSYRTFVPNNGAVTATDSTGAIVGETTLTGKVLDYIELKKTPIGPITLSFSGDAIDAYVVKFNQSSVAVDGSAINLNPDTQFNSNIVAANANILSGLYEFALNRLPDNGGTSFWLGMLLNNNVNKLTVANSFINSQEFSDANANIKNNNDFVQALNNNGENRYSADAIQAWVTKLDSGAISRGEALLDMVEHSTNTAISSVGIPSNGIDTVSFA